MVAVNTAGAPVLPKHLPAGRRMQASTSYKWYESEQEHFPLDHTCDDSGPSGVIELEPLRVSGSLSGWLPLHVLSTESRHYYILGLQNGEGSRIRSDVMASTNGGRSWHCLGDGQWSAARPGAAVFYAVTDDGAAICLAGGREQLNRTVKISEAVASSFSAPLSAVVCTEVSVASEGSAPQLSGWRAAGNLPSTLLGASVIHVPFPAEASSEEKGKGGIVLLVGGQRSDGSTDVFLLRQLRSTDLSFDSDWVRIPMSPLQASVRIMPLLSWSPSHNKLLVAGGLRLSSSQPAPVVAEPVPLDDESNSSDPSASSQAIDCSSGLLKNGMRDAAQLSDLQLVDVLAANVSDANSLEATTPAPITLLSLRLPPFEGPLSAVTVTLVDGRRVGRVSDELLWLQAGERMYVGVMTPPGMDPNDPQLDPVYSTIVRRQNFFYSTDSSGALGGHSLDRTPYAVLAAPAMSDTSFPHILAVAGPNSGQSSRRIGRATLLDCVSDIVSGDLDEDGVCVSGTWQARCGASPFDSACRPCRRCNDSGVFQFIYDACGPTRDTVCASCSMCTLGQVVLKPCTLEANTVCGTQEEKDALAATTPAPLLLTSNQSVGVLSAAGSLLAVSAAFFAVTSSSCWRSGTSDGKQRPKPAARGLSGTGYLYLCCLAVTAVTVFGMAAASLSNYRMSRRSVDGYWLIVTLTSAALLLCAPLLPLLAVALSECCPSRAGRSGLLRHCIATYVVGQASSLSRKALVVLALFRPSMLLQLSRQLDLTEVAAANNGGDAWPERQHSQAHQTAVVLVCRVSLLLCDLPQTLLLAASALVARDFYSAGGSSGATGALILAVLGCVAQLTMLYLSHNALTAVGIALSRPLGSVAFATSSSADQAASSAAAVGADNLLGASKQHQSARTTNTSAGVAMVASSAASVAPSPSGDIGAPTSRQHGRTVIRHASAQQQAQLPVADSAAALNSNSLPQAADALSELRQAQKISEAVARSGRDPGQPSSRPPPRITTALPCEDIAFSRSSADTIEGKGLDGGPLTPANASGGSSMSSERNLIANGGAMLDDGGSSAGSSDRNNALTGATTSSSSSECSSSEEGGGQGHLPGATGGIVLYYNPRPGANTTTSSEQEGVFFQLPIQD